MRVFLNKSVGNCVACMNCRERWNTQHRSNDQLSMRPQNQEMKSYRILFSSYRECVGRELWLMFATKTSLGIVKNNN